MVHSENGSRAVTEGEVSPSGGVDHVPPADVPSRLRRLERTAGRWVADRAELFDPHACERREEYRIRLKSFGELSIYLLLDDQLPVESVVDTRALRALVAAGVEDERYHRRFRRNPARIREYGYPPIFARLSGELDDRAVWRALGDALNDDHVWARERQPYALLDVWHIAKLYGHDPPYDAGTILRTSCLDGGLHPIRAELADVYPLTHDIMFAHGLGMSGFGFPADPVATDTSTLHECLILRFLAARLYDPLLELLLTGVLQRAVRPELVGLCLSRLTDVAESNGHVPDHTVDDESLDTISRTNAEALDHLDERAVDWGSQYHVNLVAGFFALCARAEWPALTDGRESWERPAYDPETLLGLGSAIDRLAGYELRSGAEKLRAVAGTAAVEAYPEVFDVAVSFLRDQRRDDGQFGYWSEEAALFETIGLGDRLFERRFVRPTSRACADALAAIDENEPG